MTKDGRNEPLLHLVDTLQQYQLRNAGAEVAAALAHAMGTPLNVISGRAELIRQDPSSALAQVTRIEEQVRKVATGLRQLVDYLAVPDSLPSVPASPSGTVAEPGSGPATLQSGGVDRARSVAAPQASALSVVPVASVFSDVLALGEPLAQAHAIELEVEGGAVEGVTVDRWHALAMLNALVSLAIRHVAGACSVGDAGPAQRRIKLTASNVAGMVMFELVVPELDVLEGWHLEHFQARPPATHKAEPYRTLSICAAVARGRGGKLQIEAFPPGGAALIRFSCRSEDGPA